MKHTRVARFILAAWLTVGLLAALAHAAPTITLAPEFPGYAQSSTVASLTDPSASSLGLFVQDTTTGAFCTASAQVGVRDLACRFWPRPPTNVACWWRDLTGTWWLQRVATLPATWLCVPSGWPATGVCCSRRIRNRRCA